MLGLQLTTATAPASAGGTSATEAPTASELPPGPLKRKVLDVLQAQRKSGLPRSVVAEPVDHALRAAERATSAHAAGDGRHASMLTKLGERWAAVAATLLRAGQAEAKTRRLAVRMRQLRIRVERAEALLGEQQARLGRLRAELGQAEKRQREQAAAASAAEDARIAGGKKRRTGKRKRRRKGKP